MLMGVFPILSSRLDRHFADIKIVEILRDVHVYSG